MDKNSRYKRVRLLQSLSKSLYAGLTGTIFEQKDSLYTIYWDNELVSKSDEIEDDRLIFDYIIEEYSLLTMDDVLQIVFNGGESLMEIKDEKIIKEIYRQFEDFTKPLLNITRKKNKSLYNDRKN